MKPLIVTTSWDDGHRLDTRLAELLKKYGLAGTFYIAPKDREFPAAERLRPAQIKALSRLFEVGAHTMTHPRLPKIPDSEAFREIKDSKDYLEAITGQKIVSFCYPGGNYQQKHLAMVRRAGLQYARTVKRYAFDLKGSRLEAPTTIHAYNHFQDIWRIVRFARFNPRQIARYRQWDNLAKAMFDRALQTGGVYHLWGHSWEIDQHGDWQKLEAVFKYISNHKNVRYLTNAQLAGAKPLKLLIAAPYFPPHLGGQENYAFHIAQQLQQHHGWDVRVATSGGKGWRAAKTSYEGLVVYRLPYLFKLSNTPFHPLWGRWLRRIIRDEGIDVVNAHAPVPVFADIAVRAAKGLPVILTYHMLSMKKGRQPVDWLIGLYENRLLPRTLARADTVICASDAVKRQFLAQLSQKTQTISPGVDSGFYRPASKSPHDTVLFVGSLNKSDGHKGLRYLIEAFSQIADQRPSAKLMVAGTGTGQPDFEEEVNKLRLSEKVTFLGGQYGTSLKDTYQKAAIFVLPSLNDNFPLTILEAMSAGLPVISTPVGSIPKLVDDARTGYLVPPADSHALADRIIQLLDHPDLAKKMGARGRLAVKTLTWQHQAAKMQAVLQTVLNDTSQGSL